MAFQDFSKRLTLTIASLIFAFVFILFSRWVVIQLASGGILIGLATLGLMEYGKITGIDQKRKQILPLLILGAVVVASFYCAAVWEFLIFTPITTVFISAVVFLLMRFQQIEGAIEWVAKAFFGLCYIAIPLGLLLVILYSPSFGLKMDGRLYLGYLILVTKASDIGAYLGGRLFGRVKLAPILSPNKTVEGALFGLGFSLIVSFGYAVIGLGFQGFHITLSQSLVIGPLLGLVGQLGDLAESLLKREGGVKDSNSFPGFGGVLDLLDSLLLTTPLFYVLLVIIKS